MIRDIRISPYRLPLRKTWRFADQALDERLGFIVRVKEECGLVGWGESAPLPALGTESLAQCRDWLDARGRFVVGREPVAALRELPTTPFAPAARCGLESALLDLAAQRAGIPLARYLHAEAHSEVTVNAAAGRLMDCNRERLNYWLQQGYRRLKFKLDGDNPSGQAQHLRNLLRQAGSSIKVRLDANRGWKAEQARCFFQQAADLPLEWIEDPLQDIDEFKRLDSACPSALDEHLTTDTSEDFYKLPGIRALVLKPMRLGGLLPCLRIAETARAHDLQTPVTTSLDGAIATHACLHLAAALDGLGRPCAHGLATSGWFREDLAKPPRIRKGRMQLGSSPGLGCRYDIP